MRLNQYLNEGKTLILYHGNYATDIKKFRTKRITREGGSLNMGAYFTDNPKMAETFGAVIYKVKIKFNKLFDMTIWKSLHADEEFIESIPVLKQEEIDRYLRFDYYGHDSPYHALEVLDDKYQIVPRMKKKGYDGVAFSEEHHGIKGRTYIAFNPNQIEILEITGEVPEYMK
jgi:hypothetical protein